MKDLILFFDGCHKIYYAEASDQATIATMKEYGYDPITGDFSKELDELWRASCSLKFVEPADLNMSKPHVSQFQKGGLRGFRTKLKNYQNQSYKLNISEDSKLLQDDFKYYVELLNNGAVVWFDWFNHRPTLTEVLKSYREVVVA